MNFITKEETFNTRKKQHHTLDFDIALSTARPRLRILNDTAYNSMSIDNYQKIRKIKKNIAGNLISNSVTRALEILSSVEQKNSKDSIPDIVLYVNKNKELCYLGRSWLANSSYHSAGIVKDFIPLININIHY